jgi:DNA-binding SARP family transcriptional activator/tetratricopeptide (TPR) repeat protein
MRFELLGPLRVRVGDAELPVTAARERILLATLLLAGQPVSTSTLIEAIWGDRPPAWAHNQVQQCVSRLRRRFADAGRPGRVIVTEPGSYRITADGVGVDLWEFRQLVATACTTAGQDPRPARELYRAALALWRGPALAAVDSESMHRAAAALAEERLRATEECIEVELTLGGAGELVAELTDLVSQHPYREGLHRALILALYRAGRQVDALTAYQHVRGLLAAELGLEPGAALRDLHRRILGEDATLFAVGPARSGRPAAPPVPRQLPAPPPMFTGRGAELAELDRVPDSSTVVIAAIDGMAGIGKTALAVQAAHRLANRYPDGQLFTDLHGHTQGLAPLDPGEVLDRTLRTLGTPGEQIPADLDGRAALYRSRLAGRRVLVLLDNAATEAQVTPLLPGTSGCLVMVTSRRRLIGIDHTHTLSLQTIPLTDAVSLFLRTTGAHRLHDQPSELVEETVERCGRLPLAIRIAAARLRSHPTWSVANLVERLRDHQDRLAELATGQRSVAAALDLSYQQLPAEPQHAYRVLGLHPGPDIDASATAALCDTTVAQARRLLEHLEDANLLQEPTPGRYRFHDLIRSHAALTARAEPDRRAPLTRLFDHYRHTATVAADTAYSGGRSPRDPATHDPATHDPATRDPATRDPAQAGAWLEAELPNLLAAAGHAAEHGWPDHTVRLSASLQQHLLTRGRYRQAEVLHHQALEIARATGDRRAEQAALTGLGHIRRRQGRHEPATDYLTQALEIARATGDRHRELDALTGLGRVCRLQGRYQPATDYLTQALEIARATGDRHRELDALTGLGHVCRQQGRYESATDHFEVARQVARATGDRHGELGTLTGLGRVHMMQGRHEAATDHFARALRIARETGDRTIELAALTGLGHIHRLRDCREPAAEHYHRALEVARQIGSRNWQFEAFHGLGRLHHATGRPELALRFQQQALRLATELRQPEDQVRAHNGLAQAQLALNQPGPARRHWHTALEILTSIGTDHTEDGEATTPAIRAHLAGLDRPASRRRGGSVEPNRGTAGGPPRSRSTTIAGTGLDVERSHPAVPSGVSGTDPRSVCGGPDQGAGPDDMERA